MSCNHHCHPNHAHRPLPLWTLCKECKPPSHSTGRSRKSGLSWEKFIKFKCVVRWHVKQYWLSFTPTWASSICHRKTLQCKRQRALSSQMDLQGVLVLVRMVMPMYTFTSFLLELILPWLWYLTSCQAWVNSRRLPKSNRMRSWVDVSLPPLFHMRIQINLDSRTTLVCEPVGLHCLSPWRIIKWNSSVDFPNV